MILTPHLIFNGNCREAFEFYATVFGGNITNFTVYEGSPMPVLAGFEQKLMYAEMIFENNRLQGADSPNADVANNSSLNLGFMEVFVMDDIFKKLSEGGTVTMPLQDTFWGARFGSITDKFGIKWMFNCDLN